MSSAEQRAEAEVGQESSADESPPTSSPLGSSPADMFCTTCGLLKTEHDERMTYTCAVVDPAQPKPEPSPDSWHHDSADAVDASGRDDPPTPSWPEVSDPETEPVNIANILLHWTEDVDAELESMAVPGTGEMLPYSIENDPFVMREDLARALVAVRALVSKLRDLSDDLAGALAHVMDDKVEHIAGWDIERTAGSTRKAWQREVLAKEVSMIAIASLAEHKKADRLDSVSACRGAQVVHAAFEKVFRLDPRAGALRDLGLDPDLFSEVTYGKPGIIVRPHALTEDES